LQCDFNTQAAELALILITGYFYGVVCNFDLALTASFQAPFGGSITPK